MESNNYEWFITQTVEAMLPRFSDPNIVLVMKIDASWTDHGYDKSGNEKVREETSFRKTFLLVFHRPHNYTKVLMGEISQDIMERGYRLLPCEDATIKMKLVADHDSCWKDMGGWVFQTFMEAWDYFDKKGIEGREIDPMFHYSIFRGQPQYWLIKKLEPIDKSDNWARDYIIELDRKIGLNEISKFMVDAQE